jgi:hypothetical protein
MLFDTDLETSPGSFECGGLDPALTMFVLILESMVKKDDIAEDASIVEFRRYVFLLEGSLQGIVAGSHFQEHAQFIHKGHLPRVITLLVVMSLHSVIKIALIILGYYPPAD